MPIEIAPLCVDIHSDSEYIHESLLTWHRFGQPVVEVELPVTAGRRTGAPPAMPSVTKYGLRAAPVIARLKFQVEEVLHKSRWLRGRS